jgi:hypothetical protein
MLSTIHTETNRPASELAAGLTGLALEVLHNAGVGGDSVEMELELWRTLTAGLERESHWRRSRSSAAEAPLDSVLTQVVHRAALEVAVSFAQGKDSADLDRRIRPWIGRLQISPRLHRCAGQIFVRKDDSGPRSWGALGLFASSTPCLPGTARSSGPA